MQTTQADWMALVTKLNDAAEKQKDPAVRVATFESALKQWAEKALYALNQMDALHDRIAERQNELDDAIKKVSEMEDEVDELTRAMNQQMDACEAWRVRALRAERALAEATEEKQ
jgi:uncharacterized protein YdcH (DUF465 family)